MQVLRWRGENGSYSFLSLALDVVSGQLWPPGKDPCVGGWVGLRWTHRLQENPFVSAGNQTLVVQLCCRTLY
jgi:hypothetical protein